MIRNFITLSVAAAAALAIAGCNSQSDSAEGEQKNETAKAPIQLPPAIQASRTYRCRDNSLVYVDFYTDNSAQLRTDEAGPATRLAAEGGNPPYVAEGFSVSANAEQATIMVPGRGSQTCRSRSG